MSVQHSHDKFFRESFSRLEIVTSFIEEYLPKEIAELIDLDTLKLGSDSYVDEALRDHQTDILYTVSLNTGDEIHLYFLFEHKSFQDKEVALQLLRYKVRIWESDKKDGVALRPILPIVIYHGKTAWNTPHDFQALLEPLPEVLRPHLPQFNYLLYDYSDAAGEELRGSIWLISCLAALRTVFHAHKDAHLHKMVALVVKLIRLPNGDEYLKLILFYLSESNSKLTPDQIEHAMLTQGDEGDEAMTTVAEFYRTQGRQDERRKIMQEMQEMQQMHIEREKIMQQMQDERQKIMQQMRNLAKLLLPIKNDEIISQMTGLPLDNVQRIRNESEKDNTQH